ncbi:MAG: FeoC-like transcriptional regulator, partial [Moraxella sp.]|nr:FeoC-like transcriptional regulator [Moraxella sp.]
MGDKTQALFTQVEQYLARHSHISSREAQRLLGKSASTVRRYFAQWVTDGLLEAVGENKQRIYRLSQEKKGGSNDNF